MKNPIIERYLEKGYRNMKLPGKDKLDRKGFKAMLLVHKKDFFF